MEKTEQERIAGIIDVALKAARGDDSGRIEISNGDDDLSRLAEAVNRLIDAKSKQVEKFRRSEARFRKGAEAMNEAMGFANADGVLTYVNPRFCEMLAVKTEDVVGRKFVDLLDPVNRDHWLKQQEMRRQGIATTYELKLERKDGKGGGEIYCVASGGPLWDEDGRFSGSIGVLTDITDRRSAEEKLKKSEMLMDESQRLAHVGSWELNLATRETIWSDETFRICGLKPQPVPPSFDAFIEKLHPEDRPEVRRHFRETLLTRKFKDLEFRIVRPDGSLRWIHATGTVIENDSGSPVRMIGAIQDISRRRSREDELRTFRFSLDQAPDAVFWLNGDGGFDYVNEQACRSLGYTRDELLRLHLWDIDNAFPKERWHKWWGEYQKDGKIGIRRHETSHFRKDGTKFPVEVSSKHFWLGEREFHVAFVRDISERKEAEQALRISEERLRQALRVARIGIFDHDHLADAVYWSPRLKEILGWSPVEPGGLPEFIQLIHPEDLERIKTEIRGALDPEGDGLWDVEHRIVRRDGSVRWLTARSQTVFEGEGDNRRPVRTVGGIRDITHLKEAEEERERLQAQLNQAQKMESVGRLAGGVAHDFNNMLGVILGHVELMMLKLPESDPLISDLCEIEKAAIRSRDITRQLLAFSRKQIIAPRPVDLNHQIQVALSTLFRLLGEDIELRFVPDEQLGRVLFDPSQIDQILVNLAVNARDAMPNGGRLTIETFEIRLDESCRLSNIDCTAGEYVLLEVADDGAGMDKETLEHIFEPFFTTKEVHQGTGLGLATVYGIVRQNDGFVNVYSEPGHGTTFKIYIPKIQEEIDVVEDSGQSPLATGTGTILLVEDDEMVREMTSTMLESIGYAVVKAETPSDALAVCEDETKAFDLLLTDVVMPGESGADLRDRVKKLRPDVKVLFMSGYTSNVIVRHGVLEEGVDFIQKPFGIKDLAAKVRDVIKGG